MFASILKFFGFTNLDSILKNFNNVLKDLEAHIGNKTKEADTHDAVALEHQTLAINAKTEVAKAVVIRNNIKTLLNAA